MNDLESEIAALKHKIDAIEQTVYRIIRVIGKLQDSVLKIVESNGSKP